MTTANPPAETLKLPDSPAQAAAAGSWNNVCAIAGVVLKEMYRRGFLVLFRPRSSPGHGSVSFCNEQSIVRYFGDLPFLIRGSSLVIAITMTPATFPRGARDRTPPRWLLP
jgi:hypothetical protein